MLTALGLLAVVALIAANGYFVAAEFSFVASRRNRIDALAEGGDARAGALAANLDRLSFMLSGAQLGITVTSLVVGFIAEDTIGAAIRPVVTALGVPEAAATATSLTIGFVVATSAQMVLGELAPKNLAIARPEPVALALARSTKAFLRAAGPVIRLFDGSANRLLRAVGVEPVDEIHEGVDPDELGIIISESQREGDLTGRHAALLSRVIDFADLRAGAVMVPRTQVVWVEAGATCAQLREVAARTGLSRFPVVGDDLDDVRGVVTAKSVLAVPADQRGTRAITELVREPVVIPESAPLRAVLTDFRRRRSHLGIVVDEHGGTAGLITLEDLVEEIVGEIHDEHDREEPAVSPLADGAHRVPGSWRIDETARDCGVELPRGDYETLSGLVMAHLERVPEVDDVVEVPGARLRVVELDGHAVATVHLEPVDVPADDTGEQP